MKASHDANKLDQAAQDEKRDERQLVGEHYGPGGGQCVGIFPGGKMTQDGDNVILIASMIGAAYVKGLLACFKRSA